MLKIFSKKMKNQKGFTLVELIVVIAIIGILGAIAVPKFSGFRESAAEKADKATAAVLANAARLAYMDEKITTEQTVTINELIEKKLLDGKEEDHKPQKSGKNNFTIKVDKDNNVIVKYAGAAEGDNLYPAN